MSNIIIAGKQFNNINKITFDTPDGDIATFIMEGQSISPKLIAFSIYDANPPYLPIEYYAEEGMSWLDWVNSEYNTDGYLLSKSGYVMEPSGVQVVIYGPDSNVLIEEGRTYELGV